MYQDSFLAYLLEPVVEVTVREGEKVKGIDDNVVEMEKRVTRQSASEGRIHGSTLIQRRGGHKKNMNAPSALAERNKNNNISMVVRTRIFLTFICD